MKSLVVYYSRTNITKKLAESIADKISADTEEIIPKVNYEGKIGYMRGGKDGMSEKIIDIETLKYNPEDYDVVYLGAPVWAGKAANPLISYIDKNKGKFTNIRIFLTAGKSGFEASAKQIEKYAGVKAQKLLTATTKEVKSNNYNLDSFTD